MKIPVPRHTPATELLRCRRVVMSKASSMHLAPQELTSIEQDVLRVIQQCDRKGFAATLDLIQVNTGYALDAIERAVEHLIQSRLIRPLNTEAWGD